MADVAVLAVLVVAIGFVMWVGHLLTGMVGGMNEEEGNGQ